ncbi:zinc finger MYM-type 2-like [Paramuricea clavata]|uniref:Zinc finger MYM-type 2-like n=1 Tax=Paramuricea clavata TaxID=317549 RepID=A0A7D9ITF1_PARCT|nr:zinc finger MYM-type 2-like [Paramuricea clavata]
MASRFVDAGSVDDFILEQENKSTAQKTQRDVKLLQLFLVNKNEERNIEDIPIGELNEYMSDFIISVRTKNGKEYEPSSLRSLLASFERHLKRKNYPASIINDLAFEKTRKTLESKQKQLKKQGKGNKPNASVALTTSELNTLYEKDLLGTRSPESLLNTLWLNNTMHFGLRGCKEHRDMCWGDVKLKQTADGEEFLEFNERQTKTRTGSDCRDVRKMAPKMFATDGSERDPVVVYKLYERKRPGKMNEDDSPFYLAVNNTLKKESLQTKEWFKAAAVGINKLNSLMKTMAQKAGINNERLRNHSGRKTMIQTLSENDIPPTHIAQLSGHKNLKSLESYSKVSSKQEMQMSKVLSGYTSGSAAKTSSDKTVNSPPTCSPISEAQQAMALFSGAVIKGGNFSININTVNQSPKLTLEQEPSQNSAKDEALSKWKRLKPLEDSDDEF